MVRMGPAGPAGGPTPSGGGSVARPCSSNRAAGPSRPSPASIKAMAECGDGVAFTRTDGQLVRRGCGLKGGEPEIRPGPSTHTNPHMSFMSTHTFY
jgi:hypothetical protein